jgi:hypothetical protein
MAVLSIDKQNRPRERRVAQLYITPAGSYGTTRKYADSLPIFLLPARVGDAAPSHRRLRRS